MFQSVAALVNSLDEEDDGEGDSSSLSSSQHGAGAGRTTLAQHVLRQFDDDDDDDDDTRSSEEDGNEEEEVSQFPRPAPRYTTHEADAARDGEEVITAFASSSVGDQAEHDAAMGGGGRQTSRSAARLAHQKFTQELLREKETLIESLQSKMEELSRDRERRVREAEYFKSTAIQARDESLRVDSELRLRTEQYAALSAEMAAHQQLSKRLLDERDKELKQHIAVIAELQKEKNDTISSGVHGDPESVPEPRKSRPEQEEKKIHEEDHKSVVEATDALETLQSTLVERTREISSLQQEVRHLRDVQRRLAIEKDELKVGLEAAEESLKGELQAHAETKASLRLLRSEKSEWLLKSAPTKTRTNATSHPETANPSAYSSGGVGNAESGGSSAQSLLPAQFHQLSHRVMELESSLEAARHDAREWKSSYERLVRQTESAESREKLSFFSEDKATRALFATPNVVSAAESKGSLKRSRRLTQLARRGRTGRWTVAFLSSVDDFFLDATQFLVFNTPLRIIVTYYFIALHLLFLITLSRSTPAGPNGLVEQGSKQP